MDIEILFCCEGGDQFNEYAADDDDLEEYVGELLVIQDAMRNLTQWKSSAPPARSRSITNKR